MDYYARKANGKNELLIDHLNKTSMLCEEYTSIFDMPVTGRVLGRLHDIGKRTEKFQNVLFGDMVKVNHAIVAGLELDRIFHKCWPDISHIIASHHYGLNKNWNYYPDFTNPMSMIDTENKENALSSKSEFEDIQKWAEENEIELTKYEAESMYKEFKRMQGMTNNERMFINRMLFSCLVDADYSASASFEDPNYTKTYDGEKLDPESMLKKLESFRNDLIAKSTSNSALNDLRNEVFAACSAAGSSNFQNYTLTAPTGTAKTLATLEFALQKAKYYNKQRIIFVLPYLSIIEQSAKIYKEICGENVVLEDDSQTQFTEKSKLLSDRWSAPIIVTTSVNLFETLFKHKGSDLRKLHNLANSIIVFDESQTIPNDILDCTLEVIDVLNKKFNTTTLFSTATPPSFNYRRNINWNAHEIINDPQDLFDRYHKIKNLKIDWVIDDVFDCEKLCEMVKDKESYLIIFNLKRHANEFYDMVRHKMSKSEKEGLFYISTNLCSSHRTLVLQKVKERLSAGLPTKVVSTQCLEAGVDLDFQYVYRAMGPATSIVQAAGRCNRNALSPGTLTIFMPEGSRLYPDNSYKNQTLQLQSLIKASGLFDINSLSDIDRYYQMVFTTIGLDSDNSKLSEAIDKFSYENVSREYRLIKNQGATVIVPCQDNIALYQQVQKELMDNDYCITKSMMKKLQKITVTSYDTKNVNAFCQELFFKVKGERIPCNWYLLDDSLGLYDNDMGLNFTNINDFLF